MPASIVEPSVREPTPVPDLAAPPATSRVREGRKAPAAGLMGDLRVAALEKRIQDNDWQGIVKDFGNLEEIGRLPPNLGLLAALAHHEASEEGDQAAVEVGVRCVAGILALPGGPRSRASSRGASSAGIQRASTSARPRRRTSP